MIRAGALAALLLPLMVFAPRSAVAESDAEQQLRKGIAHYAYGDYAASIRLLTRVSHISRSPELLARAHLYLGLNHAVTGSTEQARRAFITALTHDPLVAPDPFRIKPDLIELFRRTRAAQRAG